MSNNYIYPKLYAARQKARELNLSNLPESSTRDGKKLMIYYKGKLIHFGSRHNLDYLMTKDDIKRKAYRARASKILLKDGSPAYKNKSQPAYYSYNILW
jgi:Family of unknown function (DUF5754)